MWGGGRLGGRVREEGLSRRLWDVFWFYVTLVVNKCHAKNM